MGTAKSLAQIEEPWDLRATKLLLVKPKMHRFLAGVQPANRSFISSGRTEYERVIRYFQGIEGAHWPAVDAHHGLTLWRLIGAGDPTPHRIRLLLSAIRQQDLEARRGESKRKQATAHQEVLGASGVQARARAP